MQYNLRRVLLEKMLCNYELVLVCPPIVRYLCFTAVNVNISLLRFDRAQFCRLVPGNLGNLVSSILSVE